MNLYEVQMEKDLHGIKLPHTKKIAASSLIKAMAIAKVTYGAEAVQITIVCEIDAMEK